MSSSNILLDEKCINTIRFLSIDAVEKANSGHPGMPMGMAAIGYVLFTQFLRHNPKNPFWMNRDRFVLSAGHGSMLLYSLLHLSGYDLSLDDLKTFRQWGSKTPGHPEFGHTLGVETTTGPLGQGISTAVGMAMAQKQLNGLFPSENSPLLTYKIIGIASDGDLMEGVSHESCSLAGHLGLDSILFVYDANRITIDGSTDLAFTENVAARFKAYQWNVLTISDANNVDEISRVLKQAMDQTGKPTIVIARSQIGYGSPNKVNSSEAHGSPLGADETKLTKNNLKWPLDPTFFVPEEVKKHFETVGVRGQALEDEWNKQFSLWSQAHQDLSGLWVRLTKKELPSGWMASLPSFSDAKLSTRVASGKVINSLAPVLPELLGGSADLAPSNNTEIKGASVFSTASAGRNIHFGVREHGMAACLNGMALSQMLIPYGGTFLIFSDYMKGAMRLSALMNQQVIYILTHDSIGLGEDGPTHQPIEQVAHLRATPNMVVLRPADANETVQSWVVALNRRTGPTCLVLTRQNLPVLSLTSFPQVKSGVERGAYVLSETVKDVRDLQMILIASGSEVSLALEAQQILRQEGVGTRVVSMPSMELFNQQPPAYREQVLPKQVRKRISIEALSMFGWDRYVGLDGETMGMNGFGASAPASILMEQFGFTANNIVERARRLLG